jgi:histidinol-phosphate aminotransferase
MDLNMNIVLPPPDLSRIAGEFPLERANEYPSQDSAPLREALAARFGVSPEQVIVANGSNEIIDYSMRAFVEPRSAVNTVSPSFSMYPFFAATNGARLVSFPLRKDFTFDPLPLAAARGARIVPTPNNPTGNRFGPEAVRDVVEAAARRRPADVVLLDEAYAEYCGQDFTPLAREFHNVVCLRTFSKVYGLAGLRVGYAIASPEAAEVIARVRPPFALNALSEHFALALLRRTDYVETVVATTVSERKKLAYALEERGFRVFPSDANFLLARAPKGRRATTLAQALARRGIVVKDFSQVPKLENTLRITVGSPGISKLFFEALDSALSG